MKIKQILDLLEDLIGFEPRLPPGTFFYLNPFIGCSLELRTMYQRE
jgi:hypothetical protein